MAAQLPELGSISRLSPRVIRILGGNPGKFTLQGTNTYLLGTGPKRTLIDTGEGKPAWSESLRDVLGSEGVAIGKVILTHWHHDHVSGVDDLRRLCPEAEVYKSHLDSNTSYSDIRDGQIFRTEGATLRAFHSPGHTVDHMSLILEEEKAMFTGDNVLGHGTAVFEDLPAYITSLERMQSAFSGRAYPGHGQFIDDGPAKIREYIAHRKQREHEALALLKRAPENGRCGWESMEMVRVIYKAYPEHLHGPAEGSLMHVLRMLEGDGRVVRSREGLWSLGEKAGL